MRTEKGILFPKRLDSSSTEVLEKTYSFDDVVTISHNIPDDSLFPNKKKMVSHNEALHLDAIISEFILKYF